jgi:hypothetical protein
MKTISSCKERKRIEIHRKPAEDFDYSILPPIDCAFTSPPYFATEKYNTDGKHADEQSWSRYTTYEEWRDGFYLPVNRKTFESLSENGYQFVNIMDPKIKTKRYYASDDLIDDLTANGAHLLWADGYAYYADDQRTFPKNNLMSL